MNHSLRLVSLSLALCLLAGCATTPVSQAPGAQTVKVLLASTDRLEADTQRDASRKPSDVISFFGIAPGMTVLDVFAGGGYYTEVASHVVGSSGAVHSQNNRAYLDYAKDEIAGRYKEGRLANVTPLMAENNELTLAPQSYDAVLIVLGYHDVYFVDADNGWPEIDRNQFLAELYKGLKPGGVLGVVDHAAAAGAPAEVGGTLHRIDPQRVIDDFTGAGFVLEGTSEVLLNAEDTLDKPMFDPQVRGKTSRFVHRYRRP